MKSLSSLVSTVDSSAAGRLEYMNSYSVPARTDFRSGPGTRQQNKKRESPQGRLQGRPVYIRGPRPRRHLAVTSHSEYVPGDTPACLPPSRGLRPLALVTGRIRPPSSDWCQYICPYISNWKTLHIWICQFLNFKLRSVLWENSKRFEKNRILLT